MFRCRGQQWQFPFLSLEKLPIIYTRVALIPISVPILSICKSTCACANSPISKTSCFPHCSFVTPGFSKERCGKTHVVQSGIALHSCSNHMQLFAKWFEPIHFVLAQIAAHSIDNWYRGVLEHRYQYSYSLLNRYPCILHVHLSFEKYRDCDWWPPSKNG